jgi:hypothetical protein
MQEEFILSASADKTLIITHEKTSNQVESKIYGGLYLLLLKTQHISKNIRLIVYDHDVKEGSYDVWILYHDDYKDYKFTGDNLKLLDDNLSIKFCYNTQEFIVNHIDPINQAIIPKKVKKCTTLIINN